MIVAAVLSACSGGQQSHPAVMRPAVNCSIAELNDIALQNIRIRAQGTGYGVPPGKSVDLALVVTNRSPVAADTLVAVTSGIGDVILLGYTAIPAGGTLVIDSTGRSPADAVATVEPISYAAAAVVLSEPITHATNYEFGFEFARAGDISVDVPVVSPDTDDTPLGRR
jgi:hypothetical protein